MKRTRAIQTVYYDTIFLLEEALGGPLVDWARSLFYHTREYSYTVIIPQAVVGEAHAVLMREYADHSVRMEKISSLHHAFYMTGADMGSGIVPIGAGRVLGIMADLERIDPLLDGADLVILAIALADPSSVRLLATDSVLLRSDGIREYERQMRKDGLRYAKLIIRDRV